MKPHFAGDQVDLLIVIQLEIHHARLPKLAIGAPVFASSADQPVAGGYVENALSSLPSVQ